MKPVKLSLAAAWVTASCVGCGGHSPQKTNVPGEKAYGPEIARAVEHLMSPPDVQAAEGFTATLLVPPGKMYDPLTVIPHGSGAWVNDDGREEGERGGRLYAVDKNGSVSILVDTNRLMPPTGFDIAPAGFGTYAGHIFTLSQ